MDDECNPRKRKSFSPSSPVNRFTEEYSMRNRDEYHRVSHGSSHDGIPHNRERLHENGKTPLSCQSMLHFSSREGSSGQGSQNYRPTLVDGSKDVPAPNNHSKLKSLSDIKYPYMTDYSSYQREVKIGQGTFGEVYEAKCLRTSRKVAMKKIMMENEKEGFPITALREIKILQFFKNENIVQLLDICSTKPSDYNRNRSTFYLIFEFCEHDLAGLLNNQYVNFGDGERKNIMKQLLTGLYFLHGNKAIHRDMKTSNILINKEGIVKIADFGLARTFSNFATVDKPNRFTNRVVTLWYRPPELLLGERNYSTAIDIWGVGCIMCELWKRVPILQGKDEQHQLNLIVSYCGSISSNSYPGVEKLDLFKSLELQLPKGIRRCVKQRLSRHIKDAVALDLIDKMLMLDPSKRIDCDAALDDDYFFSDPMPQSLEPRLKILNHSNFEFTANSRQSRDNPRNPRRDTQHIDLPANRIREMQLREPAGAAFRDRTF